MSTAVLAAGLVLSTASITAAASSAVTSSGPRVADWVVIIAALIGAAALLYVNRRPGLASKLDTLSTQMVEMKTTMDALRARTDEDRKNVARALTTAREETDRDLSAQRREQKEWHDEAMAAIRGIETWLRGPRRDQL
jgi:hypothetical protein